MTFVLSLILCFAETVPCVNVLKKDGTTVSYEISKIDNISFSVDEVNVHFVDGTNAVVAIDEITEMTLGEMEVEEPTVDPEEPSVDPEEPTVDPTDPDTPDEPTSDSKEITITWDGTKATVDNPYANKGVSITVDNADVVVNSSTSSEIEYILQGTSSDGSFKIYSDKKFQLTMKGLKLTNADGPAINSQSKKKMELKAQKGFVNVLTDGTSYSTAANEEDQKGCVFSEGQIIVKGAGELTVNGNYKHGICSDDYVYVENSILTVNSASDAIHANDSVKILGGTVLLNPKSDGIDCEGMIVLDGKDCSLDIKVPGDDSKAIKSDSLVNVISGNITLTATGKGSKGIKSEGMLLIGDKQTGSGPNLTISTSGAQLSDSSTSGGSTGGWGGWGGWGGKPGGGGPGGGGESSGTSSKAIKAEGIIYVYGGKLNITTTTSGAEGLESKTAVYIEGGEHYFKCYDDCINSKGCIYFNGGTTVCYSNGNDAVDSNAGKTGAITIGNGNIFAITTKSSPEEGLDCDNNSYIQITGNGIVVSAGGTQGGSSSTTLKNASQGYKFVTSNLNYTTSNYYTLSDPNGKNLVTFSVPASITSTLSLFTAPGMVKGTTYTLNYSSTRPTDATTVVGGGSGQAGLFIGSSATGQTKVTSFVAN